MLNVMQSVPSGKSATGGLKKMISRLLMRKTIVITTLICALTSILLIGCSDNLNGIGVNKQEGNSDNTTRKTLIWSKDELSVIANGESIVNNELKYAKGDSKVINIQITYDGYTSADTSSYVSQVSILGDNEAIFIETGEQYINQHHILSFNIANYDQVRFYIALWCDGWEEYCSSAALKISNLNIYQIN